MWTQTGPGIVETRICFDHTENHKRCPAPALVKRIKKAGYQGWYFDGRVSSDAPELLLNGLMSTAYSLKV